MPTVLITGGAGFIGSHLAPLLIRKGFSVRILDSLSPQIHGEIPAGLDWLSAANVEFMRGTTVNASDVRRAIDGVDSIVHLAAETGTGQSMYEIGRYNEANSQGTAVLLDVLANTPGHGVARLVLSSSRAIYGEGAYMNLDTGERVFPKPRSARQLAAHEWEPIAPHGGGRLQAAAALETDPGQPSSIYAATKLAQEDLVRVACEALGIGFAILRFQNVYGERQSLNNPYTGVLSIFSTRIRRHLQLPIFEDGRETRDFIHVHDVTEAISAALVKTVNSVVNVGTGVPVSIKEVAEALSRALGEAPDVVVTGQYRIGDIRHNFADTTRLRELLDFVPAITLEDGLQRFANWVTTQPLPEDRLDKANAQLSARKLMG